MGLFFHPLLSLLRFFIKKIRYKRFLYWEKKLREETTTRGKGEDQKAAKFVQLMAPAKEEARDKLVVRLTRDNLAIEIPETYNPTTLLKLIETLRALC